MEKRMGRPPSTFKIRGLSEVETETLLQHALKRGVKVEALLRQVVTTVLHDNLRRRARRSRHHRASKQETINFGSHHIAAG
jgi:hypothetical protein